MDNVTGPGLFSIRRLKVLIRVTLAGVLLMNVLFIGISYANRYESVDGPTADTEVGDKVAGERDASTVITTQGLIPGEEAPRAAISSPNGAIYVIGPSGNIKYINTTYHSYWDVDPVPDTQASVLYVAGEFVPATDCGTASPCYIRHVQVLNFTTGQVRELYSDVSAEGRWHDVDRYDEDSLLVADITDDRVLVVNTTSGLVEWSWEADNAFPPSSGGDYAGDWTHINDVERLPDGRLMADLRNQDAVVFLDPSTGLQEDWTLGADGNYEVLNEQHNPDYIPESHGGPAVLVADSENDRIVEYQRVNDSWKQSWIWQSSRMNWPRDADRLPNGNTLVTDSNSDRVFEIDREGEIVWSVTADNPYEAERLGTRDESRGGESATRLQLESQTVAEAPDDETGSSNVMSVLVPDLVIDAIVFVKPVWMGFYHIAASIIILGIVLLWPLLEFYWSDYDLQIRTPVVLGRR
jgi:hypothetical protein